MCRRDPRASPDCQKGPCYKEVLRTVLGFCHPHGQSQAAALFSLDQVGREKRAWRNYIMALRERPGYGTHHLLSIFHFRELSPMATPKHNGPWEILCFSGVGEEKVFLNSL